MRIGIRDGSLGMPWEAALEAAAEIGFDGVELDMGPNYRETALWTGGSAAVAAMARKGGSQVLTFCAGVCWALSPASPDAAVRREISMLLADLSRFAGELGAGVILVPVTPGGPDVTEAEGQRRWIEEMKALAAAAESSGVILALENVGGGYGKLAGDLIALADGVDEPAVQTYYDIGNGTYFEQDPVEEIKLLGSRIAAVHIKDLRGDLLGEGVVKIPESIAALKEIGYDGDLILETPPTADPRGAAARNLEYLQRLL
jgi:sugar phosphate isomerase/epimerase